MEHNQIERQLSFLLMIRQVLLMLLPLRHDSQLCHQPLQNEDVVDHKGR
jgi:hypothetical protein